MGLTFLLGGARSGKSALALRLASGWDGPLVFVATAEGGDPEMRARIARHRRERPPAWQTVEEPLDLAGALERAPAEAFVVADCVAFWVANLLAAGNEAGEVERLGGEAAALLAGRRGPSVAVSNEVGLGVVPATALGRGFRDALGRVNAGFAAAAERSYLVVAGRTLELGPPPA